MRIKRHRLAWTAAAACLWALATGVASAQTPACQVTYTKSWEGGNGFGANIVITNNGPAITNGWTLVFNFPNGQRLQNGWPVSFTQPAGSAQVTDGEQRRLEPEHRQRWQLHRRIQRHVQRH